MKQQSVAKGITVYSSMVALAIDGAIGSQELGMIKKLTIENSIVNNAEKHALSNIFSRLKERELAPEVWIEIKKLQTEHGIT